MIQAMRASFNTGILQKHKICIGYTCKRNTKKLFSQFLALPLHIQVFHKFLPYLKFNVTNISTSKTKFLITVNLSYGVLCTHADVSGKFADKNVRYKILLWYHTHAYNNIDITEMYKQVFSSVTVQVWLTGLFAYQWVFYCLSLVMWLLGQCLCPITLEIYCLINEGWKVFEISQN